MSHPMDSDVECQRRAEEGRRRRARDEARYLLLADEFIALVNAVQDDSVSRMEMGERLNVLIRRVVP